MNAHPLLQSYPLNKKLTLKNRIVMAPMTRAQSSDDHVPTPAMADYYARRAEAGLIVTEGTVISADAMGHQHVPGIFNEEQIVQWHLVTEKVHQQQGKIFLQLWHVGRVSHPSFLGSKLPIAPSETEMSGKLSRSNLMFGKSRAAITEEIAILIRAFADAAENAMKAGFDGVEIHGANGYLIDQFLHYHTNKREDAYGGNPKNMARFALDVVKACGDRIGYERVGLRLSPGAYLNEIVGDPRDALVFQYLLTQLNQLNIAYVHTGNFNDAQTFAELNDSSMTAFMRAHYHGTVIACGGYTIEDADAAIANHQFDLIAIGRPFIANPNLIQRIREGGAIKPYDVSMLATLD